jgi:hypothetical protein
VKDFDESVSLRDNLEERSLKHRRRCVSITVGISQYKPIQSAKYCNLIGSLRATELDYIVKCPQ